MKSSARKLKMNATMKPFEHTHCIHAAIHLETRNRKSSMYYLLGRPRASESEHKQLAIAEIQAACSPTVTPWIGSSRIDRMLTLPHKTTLATNGALCPRRSRHRRRRRRRHRQWQWRNRTSPRHGSGGRWVDCCQPRHRIRPARSSQTPAFWPG